MRSDGGVGLGRDFAFETARFVETICTTLYHFSTAMDHNVRQLFASFCDYLRINYSIANFNFNSDLE